MKRERAHRRPIATMCDDTAFAKDVDVRIQGVGLELNDENKKRVHKLIVARNGRNEHDSSRAENERSRRTVPLPPLPAKRLKSTRLHRRPRDRSPPNTDRLRQHCFIPRSSSHSATPSYIKFIHETK